MGPLGNWTTILCPVSSPIDKCWCTLYLKTGLLLKLEISLLLLQVFLTNLSTVNPTVLNGNQVAEMMKVGHSDVFTIIDRSFRFEFPPGSPYRSLSPVKPAVDLTPKKVASPKRQPLKVLTPKVNTQLFSVVISVCWWTGVSWSRFLPPSSKTSAHTYQRCIQAAWAQVSHEFWYGWLWWRVHRMHQWLAYKILQSLLSNIRVVDIKFTYCQFLCFVSPVLATISVNSARTCLLYPPITRLNYLSSSRVICFTNIYHHHY